MVDLARYVVDAVEFEGRGLREVARSVGKSPGWVSKQLTNYRRGGYQALAPQSRAPKSVPSKVTTEVEELIVELRKSLLDIGADAGPHSIAFHLGAQAPSPSTIWRVLKRRGFVVAQPQKKPRSAWLRFESALPNETWQADITHWRLANGTDVEILDFIDDHSRVVTGATALVVFKAQDVVDTFHHNAAKWGYPASCLTDNGAVFNARARKGRVTFEVQLDKLGIEYKHSRPYHPQTCGKIERWHQTLKKHLATRQLAGSIKELQDQLDWFVDYYNNVRPHRSADRQPPIVKWLSRDRAAPGTPTPKRHLRVRTDKVDAGGKVTLRYNSRFVHIGLGRPYAGTKVRLYINDLDVRVVTFEGELLRHLTIDPTKRYQKQNSW